MMFDTHVLIWALRGNQRSAKTIDGAESLEVSIVNYMELLQGGRNKNERHMIRAFLGDLGFNILPLSENIGHRAGIYMEQYSLKAELGIADALIAATAVERGLLLCTGNAKHYRNIEGVSLQVFRP